MGSRPPSGLGVAVAVGRDTLTRAETVLGRIEAARGQLAAAVRQYQSVSEDLEGARRLGLRVAEWETVADEARETVARARTELTAAGREIEVLNGSGSGGTREAIAGLDSSPGWRNWGQEEEAANWRMLEASTEEGRVAIPAEEIRDTAGRIMEARTMRPQLQTVEQALIRAGDDVRDLEQAAGRVQQTIDARRDLGIDGSDLLERINRGPLPGGGGGGGGEGPTNPGGGTSGGGQPPPSGGSPGQGGGSGAAAEAAGAEGSAARVAAAEGAATRAGVETAATTAAADSTGARVVAGDAIAAEARVAAGAGEGLAAATAVGRFLGFIATPLAVLDLAMQRGDNYNMIRQAEAADAAREAAERAERQQLIVHGVTQSVGTLSAVDLKRYEADSTPRWAEVRLNLDYAQDNSRNDVAPAAHAHPYFSAPRVVETPLGQNVAAVRNEGSEMVVSVPLNTAAWNTMDASAPGPSEPPPPLADAGLPGGVGTADASAPAAQAGAAPAAPRAPATETIPDAAARGWGRAESDDFFGRTITGPLQPLGHATPAAADTGTSHAPTGEHGHTDSRHVAGSGPHSSDDHWSPGGGSHGQPDASTVDPKSLLGHGGSAIGKGSEPPAHEQDIHASQRSPAHPQMAGQEAYEAHLGGSASGSTGHGAGASQSAPTGHDSSGRASPDHGSAPDRSDDHIAAPTSGHPAPAAASSAGNDDTWTPKAATTEVPHGGQGKVDHDVTPPDDDG